MNECLFCGKPVRNKFCNVSCQNRYYNPLRTIKKQESIPLITTIRCKKCKKEFVASTLEVKYGRQYCSRHCANSHLKSNKVKTVVCNGCGKHLVVSIYSQNNVKCKECWIKILSKRNKLNKPKTLNEPNTSPFILKICECCKKSFIGLPKRKCCSLSCAGRMSARKCVKRSRNEIYFADLCKQHFKNVKTNEPMFNGWDADVIIEDMKIAVLWNGPWHFRDKIRGNHSLKQVQNRDRIKINEIKYAGYIPYIIPDTSRSRPNTRKYSL